MENLENYQSSGELSKPKRHRLLVAIILFILIAGSFRAGYVSGNKGYTFEPKDFKIINQADQPKTVDYSLLWKAIDVVNNNYIDRPINQEQVLYGAIRGAVAASGDQYTQFFDPKELESFKVDLKGSFDGIGAEIGKRNNNLVIIAPLDDSPSAKAGLLAKDVIVAVDGQQSAEWSVEQAVQKIRGPKGSEVTLTIYREGRTKTFDVKIKRQTIEVKSVKSEIKTINNKKIAIIKLSRFGDDTKALFDRSVTDALASGAQGLVLDLRNDPGGYLQTAVDIASNWVPKDGLIVSEARSDSDKTPYKSFGYGRLTSMKTVVLINGGSASASEILAGALQDNKLATLVGEKSFGKGSVQELIDLPGGSAVKVTIAKWITPGGRNLHKDGLVPDIEVVLSEEDIAGQKDPQLEKALEEVTK